MVDRQIAIIQRRSKGSILSKGATLCIARLIWSMIEESPAPDFNQELTAAIYDQLCELGDVRPRKGTGRNILKVLCILISFWVVRNQDLKYAQIHRTSLLIEEVIEKKLEPD